MQEEPIKMVIITIYQHMVRVFIQMHVLAQCDDIYYC